MDLIVKMVEHHAWLVGEMIERASTLTDEQLDAPLESPTEDGLTMRSVLSRLVGQMAMWNAAVETREYDWSVEDHEPISSMRARLRTEGGRYLRQVREVCDQGRLDETFVDAICEPFQIFTYGGMIAHVLTFAAYRRTLVVGALDRYGVPDLGWGDPMRWVAPAVG